jgi:uncharacterized protein
MTTRVHEDWLLTPYRLAVHEPTATAVIADVHLGYREARQESGEAVPLLSVAAQLAPLSRARRRYRFRELVVAGDLFERSVRNDLLEQFLVELERMGIRFAGFIPGNHDRGWESLQERVAVFPEGIMLGKWTTVHGNESPGAGHVVMGHWHAATHHAGGRRPCYLVGPRCLILPAFSKDAAGQSGEPAIGGSALRRFVISDGRVIELTKTKTMMRRSV